jgi:hypothetical protein
MNFINAPASGDENPIEGSSVAILFVDESDLPMAIVVKINN